MIRLSDPVPRFMEAKGFGCRALARRKLPSIAMTDTSGRDQVLARRSKAARPEHSHARALTLVECLFCCLIVSLAMVAAMRTLASSAGTLKLAGDRAAARALADSLMTEILSQAYKDPGALPLFGREINELLSNRASWNDVDDYDGYTDSPPSDKTGAAIAGIPSTWSRSVSVNWANPANPPQNVSTESGLKRVTISVKRGGVSLVTITGYKGDLP